MAITKNDKGHDALVEDLKDLLKKAEDFQYHDFKNTEHPTPKMALQSQLMTMAREVVDGKYDN